MIRPRNTHNYLNEKRNNVSSVKVTRQLAEASIENDKPEKDPEASMTFNSEGNVELLKQLNVQDIRSNIKGSK